MAAAHEFVYKLPEGLETIIGDRGVRLSGRKDNAWHWHGLFKQTFPSIIDEATSNLDSENEKRILKVIDDPMGR